MGMVIGMPRPEVAYHEAGHAIMALRHGWPLHEIVVTERQRLFRPTVSRGYTKYAKRPIARPAVASAAITLAGPIAQAVHRHRVYGESLKAAQRWTFRFNDGPSSDMEHLRACAVAAGPNDPWPDDFQDTARRVQRMVLEEWPRIARLAEALQRRSRLSGREVRRVAA